MVNTEKANRITARFDIEYDDFSLNVDLCLPAKGVTVLFGHSGSGKTTCLRAMAGLERLKSGYFSLNDDVWQDTERDHFVPTHRRDIGYVFQEAGLFSHLSVRRNLDYGFKRIPKHLRQVTLHDVSELLGIHHLLDRSPEKLSGGEKQRVAIARALLTSPKILLMDEPLSALDSQLKAEILPYLEKLHRTLSIPIIYVTHSLEELARLADHVVLFHQGTILRSGRAVELMSAPELSSIFMLGMGAIFDTKIAEIDSDKVTRLDVCSELSFYIPEPQGSVGETLRCRILATDVSVCLERPQHTSILNIIAATVVQIDEGVREGECTLVLELEGGYRLLSYVTKRSVSQLQLVAGMALWAQIKAVAIC